MTESPLEQPDFIVRILPLKALIVFGPQHVGKITLLQQADGVKESELGRNKALLMQPFSTKDLNENRGCGNGLSVIRKEPQQQTEKQHKNYCCGNAIRNAVIDDNSPISSRSEAGALRDNFVFTEHIELRQI